MAVVFDPLKGVLPVAERDEAKQVDFGIDPRAAALKW
jgi:hypothetical protein